MKLGLSLLVGLLMLLNTACAAGKGRVKLDTNTTSPVVDGDATGLVEGCGNQPIVGFTYCRVSEGDNAGQSISFIGPPAVCNQPEGCVFVKVVSNNGQVVWGGVIPKKQTRVSVPWSTLLSSPTFEIGHRGFWTFREDVYWLDPDGKERVSTSQGDIILRAYRKEYVPLNNVEQDPNFVWQWTEGDFLYKVTSSLRAFIKKVK